MSTFVYSVASVAIMAGGTVLNALTFKVAIILSIFFLAMTQRLPTKKKKDMTKLSRLTKPLIPKMKKNEQSCLIGSKCSMKTKNWPNKTLRTLTRLSSCTSGSTKISHSWCLANQGSQTSTSPAFYKNKAS